MADAPPSFLGIEIGGSKLQIVAGDSSGRIVRRWRTAVDRQGGGEGICRQILRGLHELCADFDARAIGVGFGGPVDWRSGRVCRSHQIDGWDNFELGDWLTARTGLAVRIENDSNLAALAEATCGAAAGASPAFYFNLGSGVGGGLVVGRQIFHGSTPGEMEFGHLRLDRRGTTVESRCSGWAVDRRIRELRSQRPDSVFARPTADESGGEARHLAAALSQKDAAARELVAELADELAWALSHVVHLLHPAVIVMGGGLSLVGEPLRAAIEDALGKHVMDAFAPGPPLRLAALGEDAVPVGALLLAASIQRDTEP